MSAGFSCLWVVWACLRELWAPGFDRAGSSTRSSGTAASVQSARLATARFVFDLG